MLRVEAGAPGNTNWGFQFAFRSEGTVIVGVLISCCCKFGEPGGTADGRKEDIPGLGDVLF